MSRLAVTGFFLFFAPDDETVDASSGAASFLRYGGSPGRCVRASAIVGRERIDVGPETSQRRARGPDEEATRRAYFPAAGGGERKGAGSRRACVPRGAQGGRARARRASRHSPVRVGSAAASHGSLSRNTSLHAGPSASRYPAVGPCVLASRGAATWYIPTSIPR